MRFLAALFVLIATPAIAQNCFDDALIYRQDVDQASGINQVLPVASEDAAVADFREFLFLDLTINGQTTHYTTTSGGTGIRSRAAYVPNQEDEETLAYTFFDIAGRVIEGQPDHFMILDGDLYWPECL